MNLENQMVPDFTLKNQSGADVSISQFRGKKVVLFFYPKDNTPGCTLESKGFRDMNSKFKEINTVILGISKDGSDDHCRFISDFDLNYDLLCDPDLAVAKLFGAVGIGQLLGLSSRATIVIDENGKIIKHYEKAEGTQEHSKDIYDFLVSYKPS